MLLRGDQETRKANSMPSPHTAVLRELLLHTRYPNGFCSQALIGGILLSVSSMAKGKGGAAILPSSPQFHAELQDKVLRKRNCPTAHRCASSSRALVHLRLT